MTSPLSNADDFHYGTTPEPHIVPAGLRIPDEAVRAPIWTEPLATTGRAPAFWLLGAHGGSGVSTLAQTWAPAGDAQRGWPAHDRYRNVVVVARTHRHGLTAAHALLLQAAAGLHGETTLLGLLTIADHDGKLPATLRRQLVVVEEAAPRAWRLPFLPHYRTLDYPQMPVWSPGDSAPEPGSRFTRPDPTRPDPALVIAGDEVFTAAREALRQ